MPPRKRFMLAFPGSPGFLYPQPQYIGNLIANPYIIGINHPWRPHVIYLNSAGSRNDPDLVMKAISHETLHGVMSREGEPIASTKLDVLHGILNYNDMTGMRRGYPPRRKRTTDMPTMDMREP